MAEEEPIPVNEVEDGPDPLERGRAILGWTYTRPAMPIWSSTPELPQGEPTCNGHTAEELSKLLRAYFPPADLEWKVSRYVNTRNQGLMAVMLVFVDNRAIQDRLDEVCGPAGWEGRFERWGQGKGVKCHLRLRWTRPDGTELWVEKEDGADESDIEGTKGGFSNSMKRAACQWGIGRYLYEFPDGWLEAEEFQGKKRLKKRGATPEVPPAFLPGNEPWNRTEGSSTRRPESAPARTSAEPAREPASQAARQEPAAGAAPRGIRPEGPHAEMMKEGITLRPEAMAAANPYVGEGEDRMPAAWLGDTFGVGKEHSMCTWLEMSRGSIGGARYRMMHWVVENFDPRVDAKGEPIRSQQVQLKTETKMARCIAVLDAMDRKAEESAPPKTENDPGEHLDAKETLDNLDEPGAQYGEIEDTPF